jgi:hypothetical protein
VTDFILHVLPRHGLIPEGVGDYANRLSEKMHSQYGFSPIFLQGTTAEQSVPQGGPWPTYSISHRKALELRSQLSNICAAHQPAAIVLHLSAYGYQARGVPFWLLRGFLQWKQISKSPIPIIVIFHELWVWDALNPMTSSYWVCGLQKHIIRRFFEMADASITMTESYRVRLLACSSHAGHSPLVLNPFSAVGEPPDVAPTGDRQSRLIVFSGAGISRLAREQSSVLKNVLRLTEVDEIIDVGARQETPPDSLFGVKVRALGRLDAREVSSALLSSRFGVVPYSGLVLGKSSVLAAYASHGVVPITMDISDNSSDGLRADEHYLTAHSAQRDLKQIEVMQSDLVSWYRGHSLRRQADAIGSVIDRLKKA